jgi:phage baseplate assembly protein gpV
MEALHALMAPQTEQARDRPVHGLVTAKVRSREDDGTYRLDYLTMGSDEPSAPARVMMPMAGGKRGTYFFPEQGDEVIVAFESGNTNLPVILGAVWNNNDKPPDQAMPSSENNVRTIVSRSGHELTFDDSPGTGKVTVKTQSGQQLVLDDTPPGKVTLASATGVTVTLDATSASMSTPTGSQVTLNPLGISLQTTGIFSVTALSITMTTTPGPIALTTSGLPITLTTTGQPPPVSLVALL